MKVLFLDESGDHNLSVIDPQYPLFVLGGVIVEHDYAEGELTDRIRAFKQALFGREDIVLHTADIARNKNGFENLKDTGLRGRFYNALNDLMRGLQFTVVACAIRKDQHLSRYGVAALDPYMLSLHVLVERFCFRARGLCKPRPSTSASWGSICGRSQTILPAYNLPTLWSRQSDDMSRQAG